jgi:hypothetical protein
MNGRSNGPSTADAKDVGRRFSIRERSRAVEAKCLSPMRRLEDAPLDSMKRCLVVGGLVALGGAAGCALGGVSNPGQSYAVSVSAGEFERKSTPVSFDLPAGVSGGVWRLRAADGTLLPVQLDGDGRGHFILEALPARGVAELVLEAGEAGEAAVEAREGGGGVDFGIGGRPVLRYNAGVTRPPRPEVDPVYARGGYIHPIFSPEGAVVTGDYPPDHLHHHGIWASWTRTVFRGDTVDFWNVADRKGDVLPVALDSAWSGRVFGGFSARHRYVALTGDLPADALREHWTGRVYNVAGADRPYWLFDLEVEQSTAESEPLLLPRYHYGGVAFRGRDDWYGTPNAAFLTSEGHDRAAGNETRARWTHIGGTADGGARGVAVLSHPENFRHPEPVRIHPNEPYFVWTPSQLGEWSIQPGTPHRVRYRYVVHDGAPDPEELDRIWNDFAHPPVATVQ